MTPGLRSQTPAGALSHVLTILDKQKYNTLFPAAEINNIFDLLAIEVEDLCKVTAPDPRTTKLLTFSVSDYGHICQLLRWYHAQPTHDLTTWYDLTPAIFQDFLINGLKPVKPTPVPDTAPSSASTTPPTSNTTSETMLPGVKQSLNDYPKLRGDKMWLSYNQTLKSLATAHAL